MLDVIIDYLKDVSDLDPAKHLSMSITKMEEAKLWVDKPISERLQELHFPQPDYLKNRKGEEIVYIIGKK